MLQIITGKFFDSQDCYVTRQRAVLFSNYRTHWDVETCVGTLRVTHADVDLPHLVYEVDQRIEKGAEKGFALVAATPDTLINDFAAVVSFALHITCTPDSDLTRRLTQAKRATVGVPHPPQHYLDRVFASRVDFAQGDAERLSALTEHLVGLERRSYEAAIRAIRRYVMGLHRIGDDLDLAYTLLVASIESLAQDFDGFTPAWHDFPESKRSKIDAALAGADAQIASQIRDVLIDGEYLALARRYREFTLAHIGPEFYREEAVGRAHPVSRGDLVTALEQAYRFRSAYVHTLRPLPRQLTELRWDGESFPVDGRPALTFRGIARVARCVISAFVARQQRVSHEAFDWRSALPGTVRLEAAPCYWVWRADAFDHSTALTYLRGFLDELATALTDRDAGLTDIRDVLIAIEHTAPGLSRKNRLTMLTLYLLFNSSAPVAARRPAWEDFVERFAQDFDDPSVESLVAHALLGEAITWTDEEIFQLWDGYNRGRFHKKRLRLPPVLEAAVRLELANCARDRGQVARARELISEAVDNLPGHPGLMALERHLSEDSSAVVDWRTVLLHQRDDPPNAGTTSSEE